MSLRRWLIAGVCVLVSAGTAGKAMAQSDPDGDRFFADPTTPEDDSKTKRKSDEAEYRGSLTSTTFGYRETGSVSQPLPGATVGAENASPIDRLFTDLRAQVNGKHVSGKEWNVRFDARVRLTPKKKFQSGTFGGNEYDAREIYLLRKGKQTDFKLGRQFVTELAAVKVDGLRFDYRSSPHFSYIGFAGAYPRRGSRSITEDYPTLPDGPMGEPGKQLLPLTAGLGGAYQHGNYYGSLGVVGIYANADDQATASPEPARVFATARGYWRQSNTLDIYHFAVVDLQGAAGFGVTNLSLGLNYKPAPSVRLTASVNRVDTETLNVTAQTKLEEPATLAGDANLVQNNLDVRRISSQSARAGISTALKDRRFEISVFGAVRERPEITLQPNMDGTPITISALQSAEVTLRAVDRRSYKGIRFSASFTSIFGINDAPNANFADVNVFSLGGSREIADGKGELEIDTQYVASRDKDATRMDACAALDPTSCFGTSAVSTIWAGGLLYYRFAPNWMGVFAVRVGTQSLTTGVGGMEQSQPDVLMTSGFARLAYRF